MIRKLSGPRAWEATVTAISINCKNAENFYYIVRTTSYDVRDAIDGQIIMIN